jgi:hypothetical protein
MDDQERKFWMGMRETYLNQVDIIERRLGIKPRTSELRREEKLKKYRKG